MKKTITILFLSLFLILTTSIPIIQADEDPDVPPPTITIPDNTGLPDPGGTDGGIMTVLTGFVNWLLTIFIILAVLSFVITGIMYIFAMGDSRSQNLENAKQNFKYSIIAVATVGATYIIIQFIDDFLKGLL